MHHIPPSSSSSTCIHHLACPTSVISSTRPLRCCSSTHLWPRYRGWPSFGGRDLDAPSNPGSRPTSRPHPHLSSFLSSVLLSGLLSLLSSGTCPRYLDRLLNPTSAHLQHEVEELQPVTMTLQLFHDVEIQNTQRLRLHVHTLEILETEQSTRPRARARLQTDMKLSCWSRQRPQEEADSPAGRASYSRP